MLFTCLLFTCNFLVTQGLWFPQLFWIHKKSWFCHALLISLRVGCLYEIKQNRLILIFDSNWSTKILSWSFITWLTSQLCFIKILFALDIMFSSVMHVSLIRLTHLIIIFFLINCQYDRMYVAHTWNDW